MKLDIQYIKKAPVGAFFGGEYLFGFQGQEKEDDVYGEGNLIEYKFRMHDVRLGRFWSVDPLAPKYAYNSPYAFSENRVIDAIELEGLESYTVNSEETMSSLQGGGYMDIYETDGEGYNILDEKTHNPIVIPEKVDALQAKMHELMLQDGSGVKKGSNATAEDYIMVSFVDKESGESTVFAQTFNSSLPIGYGNSNREYYDRKYESAADDWFDEWVGRPVGGLLVGINPLPNFYEGSYTLVSGKTFDGYEFKNWGPRLQHVTTNYTHAFLGFTTGTNHWGAEATETIYFFIFNEIMKKSAVEADKTNADILK